MGWKEEFLNKMFVEKDIENGLHLYVEHQPETIFRYRYGSQNDINALKYDQIWLSNMKCLNDKFEGQLEISYDNMNFNFESLEDMLKTKVDAMIEQVISSFYIACFCESVLKDTMWSYYANNHKGFCIEYYFNSFESPQFIFPVVYKDSKKIDINNLNESEMYKSILTKYSDWSKEDEWRIALPYYDEKTDGKVIKQPLPKAIYMGVDIEIQLKNFLMQHCEERFIELYQMELDTRKRRLIPKQIL
ncbi:MAG: DUF2971 domain-containing protein [Lachnospiraceae bacterium]|nr:DUF2971 domain-containing protein [Lachnospiraceae bacterium]